MKEYKKSFDKDDQDEKGFIAGMCVCVRAFCRCCRCAYACACACVMCVMHVHVWEEVMWMIMRSIARVVKRGKKIVVETCFLFFSGNTDYELNEIFSKYGAESADMKLLW